MDLKQGMETLRDNKTFRCILRTLLSIGIFLNGNQVSYRTAHWTGKKMWAGFTADKDQQVCCHFWQ